MGELENIEDGEIKQGSTLELCNTGRTRMESESFGLKMEIVLERDRIRFIALEGVLSEMEGKYMINPVPGNVGIYASVLTELGLKRLKIITRNYCCDQIIKTEKGAAAISVTYISDIKFGELREEFYIYFETEHVMV